MKKYVLLALILIVSASLVFAGGQTERAYPSRPITVIVPYGAGGDTDLSARLIARHLEEELGVPVVVTNMVGASGTVATSHVKDDVPADGYTVLYNHSNTLINYMTGLTDYTFTDFKLGGIAVSSATSVWAVRPDSPYNSLQDLVDDALARPGQVTFPVLTAATTHMQALEFQNATGVQFNIVDIGGSADKTRAFLSGAIDLTTDEYGTIQDHIRAGTMVPLGVFAEERNPLFPDVPTFKEQGIDVSQIKIFFFSFPRDTPDSVIEVFTNALRNVVESPEFAAQADEYIIQADYSDPQEAYVRLTEHAEYFEQFKVEFE